MLFGHPNPERRKEIYRRFATLKPTVLDSNRPANVEEALQKRPSGDEVFNRRMCPPLFQHSFSNYKGAHHVG